MKNTKSGLSRRHFLQGVGAGTALGILSTDRSLDAAESVRVSPSSLPTGEEISLSGTVLDIKSGVPVPGVEVSLAAFHLKEITDEQGRFTIFRTANRISDSTDGKHTLQLSKPGYLELSKPLETLDNTGLVVEIGKQSEFEGGWAKVPGILAAITAPRFPDRDFPVTEYGANSSGSGNNCMAFKRAVEACNSAEGSWFPKAPTGWKGRSICYPTLTCIFNEAPNWISTGIRTVTLLAMSNIEGAYRFDGKAPGCITFRH